jgi:hypothetical protein
MSRESWTPTLSPAQMHLRCLESPQMTPPKAEGEKPMRNRGPGACISPRSSAYDDLQLLVCVNASPDRVHLHDQNVFFLPSSSSSSSPLLLVIYLLFVLPSRSGSRLRLCCVMLSRGQRGEKKMKSSLSGLRLRISFFGNDSPAKPPKVFYAPFELV